MKTNENKSEKEIYMEAVVPYVTTFMNEQADGNLHAVERTVAQMKQKFALDDAQEAALQIVLFNLETMGNAADSLDEDFNFEGFLGLNTNIIVDIVMKDYRNICDHRLAEPFDIYDDEDDEDEDDDESDAIEAWDAYRDLLIAWYATEIGKPTDGYVETEHVVRHFFIAGNNEKKAVKVLEGFKKKMDSFREKKTTERAVADLIDNTIEKMMKLSIGFAE